MDKIFGILTAVVLLLSFWINYKNSTKLAEQKDSLKSEEGRLDRNTQERQDTDAKLKAEIKEKEENIALNDEAKAELAEVSKNISDLKADLEAKEAELAEGETKLAASRELRDQVNDSQDLIDQVESTKGKIAQMKADIASEEAKLETAQQELSSAEATVAAKKVIVDSWSTGESAPSLSTSVRSVYSNWGFVTLNGGNAQGVVPGSILDVLRNGEVVAQLKVTAVEQNRSAADIIPNDSGITVGLRSGDRVVAAQTANKG